jgi:hypothetical protein
MSAEVVIALPRCKSRVISNLLVVILVLELVERKSVFHALSRNASRRCQKIYNLTRIRPTIVVSVSVLDYQRSHVPTFHVAISSMLNALRSKSKVNGMDHVSFSTI